MGTGEKDEQRSGLPRVCQIATDREKVYVEKFCDCNAWGNIHAALPLD